MIRYAIACALLAAPGTVLAQTATTAATPVTVEIVATGEVTVPAQRFRMSVKLTGKGETEDAAKAALAANRAKIAQALAGSGIREAKADVAPQGTSFMSLFASLGGMSKQTVTIDMSSDDPDAKPQSVASETVQFDAPTRTAAAGAKTVIEANGATMEDEVVGLLDDYAAAARKAKADALVKARVEALSYGDALGLRSAAFVKISEKQDVVGGTLGLVTQIIGMFAPKSGTASNDITVRETLTVEFKLSR